MYPMSDPRRKSLRGAPWDGPSLTCYKKRSPNMGTKTTLSRFILSRGYLYKKRSPNMGTKTHQFYSTHTPTVLIKKDPQTWGRKLIPSNLTFPPVNIKKDPQTWGRKLIHFHRFSQIFHNKKRSPNMGTKTWGIVLHRPRG